jgi:hypothetical protein
MDAIVPDDAIAVLSGTGITNSTEFCALDSAG